MRVPPIIAEELSALLPEYQKGLNNPNLTVEDLYQMDYDNGPADVPDPDATGAELIYDDQNNPVFPGLDLT